MGFSGADIFKFLGEPTMLLIKLEKPLFFLHLPLPELCKLLDSPDSLFVGVDPPSELTRVNESKDFSPAEKLADCRSAGVPVPNIR